MKSNIFFFILLILSNSVIAQVKNISPKQAQRKVQKHITILDVRTSPEFDSSHIKGAINMNVQDSVHFMQQIQKLDKDETYLVYCRSGKRSAKAAGWMDQEGFTRVFNMKGGILGWDELLKKKNKNE